MLLATLLSSAGERLAYTLWYEIKTENLSTGVPAAIQLGSLDISASGSAVYRLNGVAVNRAPTVWPVVAVPTCRMLSPFSSMAPDGAEKLLGMRAEKYVALQGSRRTTVWVAPGLGCESLKDEVTYSKNGRDLIRQSRQARALAIGEPHLSGAVH